MPGSGILVWLKLLEKKELVLFPGGSHTSTWSSSFFPITKLSLTCLLSYSPSRSQHTTPGSLAVHLRVARPKSTVPRMEVYLSFTLYHFQRYTTSTRPQAAVLAWWKRHQLPVICLRPMTQGLYPSGSEVHAWLSTWEPTHHGTSPTCNSYSERLYKSSLTGRLHHD